MAPCGPQSSSLIKAVVGLTVAQDTTGDFILLGRALECVYVCVCACVCVATCGTQAHRRVR